MLNMLLEDGWLGLEEGLAEGPPRPLAIRQEEFPWEG